ncbi:hypothetical protein vseg_008502 [Gypsophila vaccaria]
MASLPLLRLSVHRPPPPTRVSPTSQHRLHHPLRQHLLRKFQPQPLPPKPTNLSVSRSSKKRICNTLGRPATERIISAVSYALPLINSLQYGRYLLTQYPTLALLFNPILPLFSLLKSAPYASFIAFFALYLGVVRNPGFDHFVRFNAMQALVLDVLLVLPLLLQRVFSPGPAGLGFKLMVWGHNAVFVFAVFCFVYSFVSSLLGKTPYLPFVADAAGRQL